MRVLREDFKEIFESLKNRKIFLIFFIITPILPFIKTVWKILIILILLKTIFFYCMKLLKFKIDYSESWINDESIVLALWELSSYVSKLLIENMQYTKIIDMSVIISSFLKYVFIFIVGYNIKFILLILKTIKNCIKDKIRLKNKTYLIKIRIIKKIFLKNLISIFKKDN